MTCLAKPQSLSNFNRRSCLSVCSSWVFNIFLMADQCALGCCVFSSVDSLCISTISSFKTHSRGRPGFFICAIELKLSVPRFNSSANCTGGFLFSDLKTRVYDTRKKHVHALILAVNSKTEKALLRSSSYYITENQSTTSPSCMSALKAAAWSSCSGSR